MSDLASSASLSPSDQSKQHARTRFPIVGLGASEGGLNALEHFLKALPADSGMAFVVLVHLPQEQQSQALEHLQAAAAIPVAPITGKTKLEPNHIYVAPPTQRLLLTETHVEPSNPDQMSQRTFQADVFFRALADTHQTNAIGIVLSGAGADGSVGLKRIKKAGGIIIAQDPEEAEFDSMPRNAINTGMVDFVLPVAQMPGKLIQLWQNSQQIRLPAEADTPLVDESSASDDAAQDVLAVLYAHTGYDFSSYKRSVILRRIERRMQVNTVRELPAYRDFLIQTPEETSRLLGDLLIGVTNFFRDRKAFDEFEREVIPRLFEQKTIQHVVRVWSTGCSTGEEAYSVAMLLLEYAAQLPAPPEIQIFATDIDENALRLARLGMYSEAIETDVSPHRLQQFFTKEPGGYRIKKAVRDLVVFASHNLILDPPFSKLDAVICRNLLIYFNRQAQERVLESFHFGLRPGGFLFLGLSESTDGASDLYDSVNQKYRLFQRKSESRSPHVAHPFPRLSSALQGLSGVGGKAPQSPEKTPKLKAADGNSHLRLVEQFAPPSVLVNADAEIVFLSKDAGRFLRIVGGKPTLDLMKVILPELRLELRSALFQTIRTGLSTEARRIPLEQEGRLSVINLVIRPSFEPGNDATYYLVQFIEIDETLGEEVKEPVDEHSRAMMSGLEEESKRLREQLQQTVSNYEAIVEELKSSNEELQSVNEELRSSGEELEVSKEELQSLNEELHTINQELRINVEEVTKINDDLLNLMASTEIATVFLDRSLRIKRFTPQAANIFNLIPSDVGRPLDNITHKLHYENLQQDAEQVILNLRNTEQEVSSQDERFYLVRMLPYRTTQDVIDGVVLNVVDITKLKKAEAEASAELRATQLLHDLNMRLVGEDDFQVIYEEILGTAIQLTRADAGKLQILNTESKELELLAARGFEPALVKDFFRINANSRVSSATALAEGKRTITTFDTPGAHDPDHLYKMYLDAGFISAQSTPLVSLSGKVIGMLSTYWRTHCRLNERELRFLDLLGRQAANSVEQWLIKEALLQSNERIRIAAEAAEMGTWDWNLTNNEVHWNERHFLLLGMKPRPSPVTADEFFRHLHPEDSRMLPERLNQAISQKSVFEAKFRVCRDDGEVRWMSGYGRITEESNGQATKMSGVMFDITAQKLAEEKLIRLNEQLEQKVEDRTAALKETNFNLQAEINERQRIEGERIHLQRRLVAAQELERQRISRDIHDQCGQLLIALRLKVSKLKEDYSDQKALQEQARSIEAIIGQLDSDVDSFARELRTSVLDDLGLQAALANYTGSWSQHTGIPIELHTNEANEERLDSEIETTIYRITQEALNNTAKYAKATQVSILLECRNDSVSLIVEDNGIGFDPETISSKGDRGLGIAGMKERATIMGGTFQIESTAGQGTTIIVRIPRSAGQEE